MSYHIYTTEGIILKRGTFGEANVVLHVLTHDFGLIIASARSARLSASKLRPALQEYNLVSLSCIKGKNGWKITNVIEKGSFYFENPAFTHRVMSQISSILMKMIPGESPNKEVFEIVKSGFDSLRGLSEKNISNFEVLALVRILHELGYVVKNSETEYFLMGKEDWSVEVLRKIEESKKQIVAIVNKALKESQL